MRRKKYSAEEIIRIVKENGSEGSTKENTSETGGTVLFPLFTLAAGYSFDANQAFILTRAFSRIFR